MQGCTVSVVGGDGKTHELEVMASSLFDAVHQAAQQWARLWWYDGQGVVEVRSLGRHWRVRLERVRSWARRGRGLAGRIAPPLVESVHAHQRTMLFLWVAGSMERKTGLTQPGNGRHAVH